MSFTVNFSELRLDIICKRECTMHRTRLDQLVELIFLEYHALYISRKSYRSFSPLLFCWKLELTTILAGSGECVESSG